jgi:diguanylate cyclase (GGDEF)-like protein
MKTSRGQGYSMPSIRQSDLHRQNTVLRQKLDEFMSEARRNERKLRRFESVELQLIGLNSLAELIKALVYPDNLNFHWDVVTLLLVDPEYEIRRMLEEEGLRLDDHPNLLFASSMNELEAIHPHSMFPTLGPYRPGRHTELFSTSRPKPASVALLPLVRYGKLIGSLNIGSFEGDRFVKGVRTDFFEHFAAIVSICIENAANVQRLKRQGLTDTLTAINNRRFFDQRLKEEMELAQRNQSPLSCMLLDVDFFKRVNDTYGHQVGDQVLREVAALIRAQLRGSDVLSRYGGEEFAALLAKTDAETAEEVAERVRRSIEEHRYTLPDGEKFNVTISIGVATYHPAKARGNGRPNGDLLIGHADRCLYQAKSSGRNCINATGELSLEEQEQW